jgi:hypothetical protein
MRYYGSILNLKNFIGPISITRNTFDSNRIKYQNCSSAKYIKDPTLLTTSTDNYLTLSGKGNSQMRNLISILNTSNSIIITDNTFN